MNCFSLPPAHLSLAGTVPDIGSTASSRAVLSEDRLDSTKLKWYGVLSLLMRYTVSLAWVPAGQQHHMRSHDDHVTLIKLASTHPGAVP